MSIPASWRVIVAPDSQGVRIMAENTHGEAVCPLITLTHEQAGQLSVALLSMRRQQREAQPKPVLA
jgi:hypothetical protein